MKFGKIIEYFTFLAVFISCLGLFGLSILISEQRTKEIGIRKVLGASLSGIVRISTIEFMKWIILANIIALPVASYIMNKWLQNFAYHTDIGIFTFIVTGVLSLVIAFLTVSYQAARAAYSNPVNTLKYE